jgi:hypothetical protein
MSDLSLFPDGGAKKKAEGERAFVRTNLKFGVLKRRLEDPSGSDRNDQPLCPLEFNEIVDPLHVAT